MRGPGPHERLRERRVSASQACNAGAETLAGTTTDRITIDPEVCGGGRPCIRGLRLRVKDVLDMLAGGATREEIITDYPYLEDEDITAALARERDRGWQPP